MVCWGKAEVGPAVDPWSPSHGHSHGLQKSSSCLCEAEDGAGALANHTRRRRRQIERRGEREAREQPRPPPALVLNADVILGDGGRWSREMAGLMGLSVAVICYDTLFLV